MYFLIQGFRGTAWNTQDSNFGGTGLTNINYANFSCKTKYVDAFKYYQKVLLQLAMTTTEEEKEVTKKLTRQFIIRHSVFWTNLGKINTWRKI